MRELVSTSIYGRLAEDDISFAYLIIIIYVFSTVKPHYVADVCAIKNMSHHPHLSASHRKLFKTQYLAYHLHKSHVAPQLGYLIHLAAVDILIWIVFQEVTPSIDTKFFAQYLFAFRTYAM